MTLLKNNQYWVMRHGFSQANEQGIIVSTLENGVKEQYGLTELGRKQAEDAGRLLLSELGQDALPALHIYYSPFSRTKETAELAAAQLGLTADSDKLEASVALVERYFGGLELQSHESYEVTWRGDVADTSYRPGGDGESIETVAQRTGQLLQELEQRHSGAVILLVSHGDTLSITRAACAGAPLATHREFKLTQAEFCRLG